jgi:membrane-associated phospholipid phosphatase
MPPADRVDDARVTRRPTALPATRGPTALLVTGLLGLVIVVAYGIHVAVDPADPLTQGPDDAWRAHNGARTLVMSPLVMLFQQLGRWPGVGLIAVVIPAVLTVRGRWRSGLFLILGYGIVPYAVCFVLKNLVDRPRPAPDAALGLPGPLVSVDHGSYPSGHSIVVGSMIVAITVLIPWGRRTIPWARVTWWALGVLLAVGMIWQRTLVNAHFLSDTVAGLLLGASCAAIVWWVMKPWVLRAPGPPSHPPLRKPSRTR